MILKKFDFIKGNNIHFVGIGGISMSALAQICLNSKYAVTGSDQKDSSLLDRLRENGAVCYIGHDSSNIKNADVVVYTAAINKDNPELVAAKKKNIPTYERSVFLGLIMKNYNKAIGISGTHGKTTTTNMLALCLLEARFDPTLLLGGVLKNINGNFAIGNSEYFLTEACEYVESFLDFFPRIGVILNIDLDHLDYYRDIEHIEQAFRKYADLIPSDGVLVANGDDARIQKILNDFKYNTLTFGTDNKNDLIAKDIVFDEMSTTYSCWYMGEFLSEIKLNTIGKFNVMNSLAAIGVALTLGIDINIIKHALSMFGGTKRRFEYIGNIDDIKIYDDYAHHPTEIMSTMKSLPQERIHLVFQPHTYTRTLELFDEFVDVFAKLNVKSITLVDIYAAREPDTGKINSKMVADAINAEGRECFYASDFGTAKKILLENAENDDIILTMGAGDVYKIGKSLL